MPLCLRPVDAHLAQVVTGAEGGAGAPEHDHPHRVVAAEGVDRALQLDFDSVVPGHGVVTSKQELRKFRESTLTLNHTPGHTRGCSSWGMKLTEGGKLSGTHGLRSLPQRFSNILYNFYNIYNVALFIQNRKSA